MTTLATNKLVINMKPIKLVVLRNKAIMATYPLRPQSLAAVFLPWSQHMVLVWVEASSGRDAELGSRRDQDSSALVVEVEAASPHQILPSFVVLGGD